MTEDDPATGAASPEPRVALVTGAARGIGAATVAALVAQGHRVVAADWCAGDTPGDGPDVPYSQPTRADLADVVTRAGPLAEAAVVDVRDGDGVTELVAGIVERHGRLDVVVAAAAVLLGGRPAWETPVEELDLQWDIDVKGVWHAAAAAIPAMLAGPDPSGCRFIAIASAAAHRGLFRLAAYSTVKHAVAGLVKGLAADLVGTGISVIGVSPGSTRTPMLSATADLYGLTDVEEFADHQLLGRLLQPEEIAATIAHLASPAGGAFNGTIVEVDGGFRG